MSKKSKGLLPTPRAREGNCGDKEKGIAHGLKKGYLDSTIAMLATPTGRDWKGRSGIMENLPNQIESYSPQDSPASPSQPQDEEKARQTVVTSGLKLSQLLKLSSPIGCCLRMLLESSAWYSRTVRLEWQAKPLFAKFRMTKSQTTTQSQEELTETSDKQGMRQFGLLFQLVPSTPRTEGIESGLLRTPTAEGEAGKRGLGKMSCEEKRQKNQTVTLTRQIRDAGLLPTPQTMDAIGMTRQVEWRGNSPRIKSNQGVDGQAGIRDVIAMLPTPRNRDYKGSSNQLIAKGRSPDTNSLSDKVEQSQNGQRTGMKLHSDFVCWMQGFPLDWLDV